MAYPTAIDTGTSLPNNRTSGDPLPPSDNNNLANAVIQIETKLGAAASTPTTAGQVLTATGSGTSTWQSPASGGTSPGNATTTSPGIVQLSGDIGGTYQSVSVLKVAGVTISGTPSAGQTLYASSGTAAAWATPVKASDRVVTGTYASTVTPNGDTTDIFRLVLTGNVTLAAPSGTPKDGQKMEMHLIQDSTGSRGASFGTGYKFATSLGAPTLSTTPNAEDVLGFKYDATSSKWRFYGIITGF